MNAPNPKVLPTRRKRISLFSGDPQLRRDVVDGERVEPRGHVAAQLCVA